jgi:hypothetical protein
MPRAVAATLKIACVYSIALASVGCATYYDQRCADVAVQANPDGGQRRMSMSPRAGHAPTPERVLVG